jgi:hypothetical protein
MIMLNKLNGKNRVLKTIKNYLYLIVSILIVTVFVLYLAPCIDDVPFVKPLTNFIDDREIDAGAIYYTDIEEFSIAEINMKNTIDYSPHFISNVRREREKLTDN